MGSDEECEIKKKGVKDHKFFFRRFKCEIEALIATSWRNKKERRVFFSRDDASKLLLILD